MPYEDNLDSTTAQKFLYKKVESIETRLDNHIVKIESKLDQIVNIMQQVATLQERESRNSNDIIDVRNTLKESLEKFSSTIQRLHDRMDSMQEEQEKNLRAFDKESQSISNLLKKDVDVLKKEVEETDKVMESRIYSIETNIAKWQNRGIGVWLSASVFIVIVQAIGGLLLSSMKDDYQTIKVQVSELQKKVTETEAVHKKILDETEKRR